MDPAPVSPLRHFSLPRRVALFIALLLLPLLCLAFYFAKVSRDRELDHMHAQASAVARAAATYQGAALAQLRRQLMVLAADASGGLLSDCDGLLKSAVSMQTLVYQMTVTDESGRVICGTQPHAQGLSLADRGYFARAVARRQFVLSQALQARNDSKWTMVAAQPIITGPELRGVLLAAVDLKWAQDGIANLHLPRGSVISMTDAEGTIVARMPQPEQFVGTALKEVDEFKRAILERNEGYVDTAGLDGTARTIFFTRVPGSELYLRIGIPKAEVDAAGWRALGMALAATAAVLALTLLLGWGGAHQIVLKPVRRLTRAAERLGEGNWNARTGLPHNPDAIGRLAEKLDELADHGQQVNRAFKTLSAGNRTLLRARDEPTLLKEMCQVAVEKGGYTFAYVSYAQDDEEKRVLPMGYFGENAGYLESLNMSWAENDRGMSTVSLAIRSGEHSIIRDVYHNERLAPWREECIRRGFGAVISLPLNVEGRVIGAFTLIAREDGSFSDDEVALLDEMAADLSFGIATVRARVRHAEAERVAARTLTHDSLTGLPNRAQFVQEAKKMVAKASDTFEPVAIVAVHLSRLQEIVDGFGYNPGLSVVREAAARLARMPLIAGSLARVQPNEFAVCMPGRDANSAGQVAEMILAAFEEPVHIGEAAIDVSATVGVSCYPGHGEDVEALLRRAAIAAREGVKKDRSYTVYRGATDRENPDRLALAAELRGAISRRELVLYYQAKMDIRSGQLHSSEALVRWPHPNRGLVSPAQFVHLAEETGLIRPMTANLVEAAIRQQHMWMREGSAKPVAVNLSVRNLYDPRFLESLEAQLETWGVPGHLMEFEITEGALVDDPETAKRVLARLRQLGSKTYIDDFGTGYSSLNYLVTLPVHALKIDQSFVKSMSRSPEAHSVVASIISMAHNLGLEVVAEGVETDADLAVLANLGCDKAQGYFFSKPVPSGEFAVRFLKTPAAVV